MAQERVNGVNYDVVRVQNNVSPEEYGGDSRGFQTVVQAGTRFLARRKPTIAAGVFFGDGDLAVAPNSMLGEKGDYLRTVKATIKAGTNAGIYVSQLQDPIFGRGFAGNAIAAGTSVSLTSGTTFTLPTANALADRVVSIKYKPTDPAGNTADSWFTTTIASHPPIAATTFALTLSKPIPAGAAPTDWIIHGVKAQEILDPDSPAGTYNVACEFESETGGFVAWVNDKVALAEFIGVFAG